MKIYQHVCSQQLYSTSNYNFLILSLLVAKAILESPMSVWEALKTSLKRDKRESRARHERETKTMRNIQEHHNHKPAQPAFDFPNNKLFSLFYEKKKNESGYFCSRVVESSGGERKE